MTTDRFPRPVVCAWCGNRHRAVVPFETTTQGDGCAASVFQVTANNFQDVVDKIGHFADDATKLPTVGEWLLNGHYGSGEYDCGLFRFVKNPPTKPDRPICNNCIGERDYAGDLERIEGNFP